MRTTRKVSLLHLLVLLVVREAACAHAEPQAVPVSTQPAGTDSGGPRAQAILPALRPRPADLLPQFVGGGPCRTDADCTVSRATGGCSFCGGCDAAMTMAEYEKRAKVSCEGMVFQPVACSPCQQGPDRATCIEGECIGVLDARRMEAECQADADCALVAYEGCCTCPERWLPARLSWIEEAQAFCATQPCGLPPSSCSPLPRPAGRVVCLEGRCGNQ